MYVRSLAHLYTKTLKNQKKKYHKITVKLKMNLKVENI